MTDEILLILKTGDTDDDGCAIQEALRCADSTARKVVALQILGSHLYHWSRWENILPAQAKARFVSHIREEVLKEGREKAAALQKQAQEHMIRLEIRTVESEDPGSVVAEEAGKGYDTIFLPKERKKFFPLLEKTLAQHLRKTVRAEIIAC